MAPAGLPVIWARGKSVRQPRYRARNQLSSHVDPSWLVKGEGEDGR